jgi:AraC family transcriptional regulator, ethanolamine operon transcriptional activator
MQESWNPTPPENSRLLSGPRSPIYCQPVMRKAQQKSTSGQVLSGVIKREGIEGMAWAVRHFFDLEATQLEPGQSNCQIDFVATGGVIFYHENYPLRTHLRGELLGGRFGLALPVGGPPIKFAGEDMAPCRLASAMSGEEMDVHAGGGLQQIVVLVDQSRLLELADASGLHRDVVRALQPGRSTMPLVAKPASVDRFGAKALRLLKAAASGGLQLGREDLEELVYGEILSLVDVKDLPRGCPSASVLVRRATEIVDAHPGPLPIATLCHQLRTSPSTLECSFKKITGLTPHTFFLRRRLNRARTALLEADRGEDRVTDIALELGFTELGRFAVRYRQLFGECPSETLRRQTATTVAPGF